MKGHGLSWGRGAITGVTQHSNLASSLKTASKTDFPFNDLDFFLVFILFCVFVEA